MRRARPVALTALAAILAMIPLSESAFWGPMAFTIMGGLSVTTFLTLFLLPAVYAPTMPRGAVKNTMASREKLSI
jgi:multidrug efflux pump subunit AcrB